MIRNLILCAAILPTLLVGSVHAGPTAPRPNILFILADDLGWSDLGCYGSEMFQTPSLDRLAAEGLRFTDAYAPAPICSASRAAFLTGKSPARLGFEFVTKNEPGYQPLDEPLRAPPFTLNLPLEEVTIAEVLRDAGYRTAFFGKWHLNQHYKRYLGWSPTHGPKAQGFTIAEEDFGSHPYSYWSDKKARGFMELQDGEFPEDGVTMRAIDFLRSDHDAPFFLMVSHYFVHTPVHTRVKWLHDRCLAAIPAGHPRRAALAHYGAMVATLDHHVGELLDALRQTGLADSTLVVFTSDNGGHPEYAGNAPLRGSKWNLYEGGIRVPMLMRWPGRIAPGTSCATPVTGIDLFPTWAGLAGAPLPDALDGRSLAPLLRDPSAAVPARDLIWHFPYYHPEKGFAGVPSAIGVDDGVTSQTRPQSAIRSGPWKLLHFYESGRDALYHTGRDLSEQVNGVEQEAGKAAELRHRLDLYLESFGARLPTANPDHGKRP